MDIYSAHSRMFRLDISGEIIHHRYGPYGKSNVGFRQVRVLLSVLGIARYLADIGRS